MPGVTISTWHGYSGEFEVNLSRIGLCHCIIIIKSCMLVRGQHALMKAHQADLLIGFLQCMPTHALTNSGNPSLITKTYTL